VANRDVLAGIWTLEGDRDRRARQSRMTHKVAGGSKVRTRQARTGRRPWRPAIGVLVLVLVAACSPTTTPSSAPSVVSAIDSGAPTSVAFLLPDLDMPGTRSSPAGQYGWDGRLGSRTGMHSVVVMAGGGYRQTQVTFAVENDCFSSGEGPAPVPTTVAGLGGWYVEPYDGPGVLFMPERESGQTTGGYALSIGDRTLCVYLTWDLATTTDELGAARQVVESIRGHAFGPNGIRITFTLPNGWDVG
jgi:hypothetical protein